MHILDTAFCVLIGLSAIIGIWRGLVKETIALLTWILAIFLALEWQDEALLILPEISSKSLSSVLAFLTIFIGVFILGLVIRFLIRWLIVSSGLSPVDRVLGSVFGVLRGLLIIAVLAALGEITPYTIDWGWEKSVIVDRVSPLTQWMQTYFHTDEDEPVAISGLFQLSSYVRGN